MPYGTELVLEVTEPQLRTLLRPADLAELDDPDATEEDFPDGKRIWLVWVAGDALRSRLRDAQLVLVRERFDPGAHWVGDTGFRDPNGRHLRAVTPAGRRLFSEWTIEAFGSEDDQAPVLGVSLWSRYRPAWLDWAYEHGGSGDPIRLDEDTATMLKIARTRLAEVWPVLATAPVTLVHQCY